MILLRVDVEDVRSLKAGAVAARRDANAASLVRLIRNCPEPSNAPPSASISSDVSFVVALVEVGGDLSKLSASGEGVRAGSACLEATGVSAGFFSAGTTMSADCAVATAGLSAKDFRFVFVRGFFVDHIGSRFLTGASVFIIPLDVGIVAGCAGCVADFVSGVACAVEEGGASIIWAILTGKAVSGGDNGSGSSKSGPHMTEETFLRSRLEGVLAFSVSSEIRSTAVCGDAAGDKPILDVSAPKSEKRRAPGL